MLKFSQERGPQKGGDPPASGPARSLERSPWTVTGFYLLIMGSMAAVAGATGLADHMVPFSLGLTGWLLASGIGLHSYLRRVADGENLAAARAASREAVHCLDVILASLPDALVLTDQAGRIRSLNRAASALFQLDLRQVADDPVDMLLEESFARQFRGNLTKHLSGDDDAGFLSCGREIVARRSDGTTFPAELSVSELERDGQRRFVLVLHDSSTRKQALARLDVAEKVLECTMEGVVVTDRRGCIEWVNHAFGRISGYDRAEVLGKTPAILKSGLQPPEFYGEMWNRIRCDGTWEGEIWNRRKNGEVYPEWLCIRGLPDRAGQLHRYVGVFSDLSKHKRAEETIRTLTYYDAVTHLPNRYLFMDRLAQSLERAQRTQRRVALVMVGLARFSAVNETLGHQMGDTLLLAVAERLGAALRGHDTVARLRGDTFCCLLTDLAQDHDAHLVISRLLDSLGPSFEIGGHELFVTAAIGISVYPLDGADPNVLVQKAETAMNRSKECSDNPYEFYTPEMHANSVARLRLETDLRKALARGELVVHYQPKIETGTGHLVGAEALLRWHHRELGMVAPTEFIPVAEETGLILPIGTWVLNAVCAEISRWQADGTKVVPIAVNLSAHQFRQPDLVDRVIEIITSHGIDPALIELELTESAVMHNPEQGISTLMALHDHGIGLAIDDFGTGYSSLSYLKRFPLDRLKIDRSFVHDIDANSTSAEIVSAIIAMAHSLNLAVVAEGVETQAQLTELHRLGCDHIQGFYYSKAIPAPAFSAILQLGRMTGADAKA